MSARTPKPAEVTDSRSRSLLSITRSATTKREVAVEPGAAVVHRRVEPEPVERVAQVVVRVDVLLAAGARVAVEQVLHAVEQRAPPAAVDHRLDALAVGEEELEQRGEVGRRPVAGDVALGEADVAALKHAAVEGVVVDEIGGRGLGGAVFPHCKAARARVADA